MSLRLSEICLLDEQLTQCDFISHSRKVSVAVTPMAARRDFVPLLGEHALCLTAVPAYQQIGDATPIGLVCRRDRDPAAREDNLLWRTLFDAQAILLPQINPRLAADELALRIDDRGVILEMALIAHNPRAALEHQLVDTHR